jgi:transposase
MEDVLDVYKRPYDPKRPQVCFDERPKQLVAEVRVPLPQRPGRPAHYDYEYKRNGVANIFMMFEPLAGKRHVEVTEHRTKKDWAECMQQLVDEIYPRAERIVVVMDNLNTHTKASLYEAFEPAETKRIADKLEIHYTPKHGSWLNMAEIEISVLSRQCLAERMGDIHRLENEVLAWELKRNTKKQKVNWCFSTEDARIKLKRLYP